ncbi:hypothetical protein C8Q75DRAFT_719049 [Abortiporus biennis]|nr:hypothetical protein C8Q75DRAFT_719049 [Abortiporus biennis]
MQSIIAKSDWHVKLFDGNIRQKWIQEAIDHKIRKEVAEWALKELEWCAQVRDNETGIEPTGIDHVWKSDDLIPSSLHDHFLATVGELEESLPEDFHPGTDGQVKNLIHPSLFCLVYGLSVDNNGNIINEPDALAQIDEKAPPGFGPTRSREHPKLWSHKYQWLPAEFLVDKNNTTKIVSYINGLPIHIKGGAEMYSLLAEIFSKTIPLFEKVLSSLCLHHDLIRFPRPEGYNWWADEDGYPPEIPEEQEEKLRDEWWKAPEGFEKARWKYWEENFNPIPVPLPKFPEPGPLHVPNATQIKLGGHRLQVIVKIGKTLLTPDKPQFNAGNWHVEGMANERIVATAIYYFDSENIKDDHLRFRSGVSMYTSNFVQDDDEGAHLMYGLHRDQGMVQESGDIATRPGRLLVFPNIYQHSIGSFSLEDPTKPGHRSILVFFLIDPLRRIMSTAHVPPQDPSWYPPETTELMLEKLPTELVLKVGEGLSSFTRELAEEHRLKLMAERTYATDAVTNEIFMGEFNLCEH